jgi:hypothetical protein
MATLSALDTSIVTDLSYIDHDSIASFRAVGEEGKCRIIMGMWLEVTADGSVGPLELGYRYRSTLLKCARLHPYTTASDRPSAGYTFE